MIRSTESYPTPCHCRRKENMSQPVSLQSFPKWEASFQEAHMLTGNWDPGFAFDIQLLLRGQKLFFNRGAVSSLHSVHPGQPKPSQTTARVQADRHPSPWAPPGCG